ncbi:L-type lectin-domain containing receptor kinase IX.1-like [Cryptomeria japonica]|uniref:L-type lectin-domain containing receptor kinase IX.1-like n=1 Tax=Cryptomeria japonica TaxID=3369 RepID=UPI0027DA7AE0|nr:L-type lectin-domain containing receptor kinase IX.1-like [Cryptomeria japonica]
MSETWEYSYVKHRKVRNVGINSHRKYRPMYNYCYKSARSKTYSRKSEENVERAYKIVWNIGKFSAGVIMLPLVNLSVSDGSLNNGRAWDAWVDYDGVAKKLQLFLSFERDVDHVLWGLKPATPILSYDIDLSQFLPQNIKIGFFASTVFNSTESHKAAVVVVVATIVGFALFLAWWCHGRSEIVKSRELDKRFAQVPQKFTYAVLRAATKNFSYDKMLGKGGFGQVYVGILPTSKEIVAVKRISQSSRQGQKEYISELSIISKLRHRNLVQLHGWCHEKGRLLLVYEFLPHGSLDKYLFGEQRKGDLNWERRYSITCDIASALMYLHEDWDQRVVHRDVKASNVMLDSDFVAKLGDFGLARVVEREREACHTTVVAGTMGYLAPEYVITGKASLESDVFSFGAVSLEIACGTRALDRTLDDHNGRLVEWVWDLYGKGKILDAADTKLGGNFNGEEMKRVLLVGLSCSHPDTKARLSIRQVIDILKMKAPLPPLPPSYPETVYTSSYCPVFAFSSAFGGTFCTAENTWNIERA